MSNRGHWSSYDEETTARCERALLSLLGDLGPWRERLYLAGGLAPRYLVGQLRQGAAASAIAEHPQVTEAVALLEDRFRDVGQDGPSAYASFLAMPDNEEEKARLRQQAVATISEFLRGFRERR